MIIRILYYFTFVIIHLYDNSGELKFDITDEDKEYTVGKVKYIVTATFDDDSEYDLCKRFISLIKNAKHVLTLEATEDTIDSESVSAVGKDENEKDS